MPALRRRVLLLVALASVAACARAPSFQGDALDPPRPTLDFALRDQSGRQVRLSGLRGEVVVLAFLYTSCPDLCPLVTRKLHQVSEMLGGRRQNVTFLAVTVDPARDSIARIRAYSQRWDMQDRWRFLTGTESELRPVWRYYWVGEVSRRPLAGADPSDYEVEHAAPVHLIDAQGRVRVAYGSDFRPAALAHDIRVLLGDG